MSRQNLFEWLSIGPRRVAAIAAPLAPEPQDVSDDRCHRLESVRRRSNRVTNTPARGRPAGFSAPLPPLEGPQPS